MASELPLLEPKDRVLSTLEQDGSRRWLFPRLAKGRFLTARRAVAYGLIAIYALLPFITIGGKPVILLDLWRREFTFFGFTFLPTDTVLLAIFVVMMALAIFFVTALAGRVWCGWACPQTVYMEFVFRPIERLFTGRRGVGGTPGKKSTGVGRVAMLVVYLLICIHLSNVFLAYFVGAENVHRWIWTDPPWRNPGAFLLVMAITGMMMFDFAYWREQLCIIGCPYGRFQSVMLDRSSLIIGYDKDRGEPRGKGRRSAENDPRGDCVDCNLCVAVCPTGIDIRDGLQLECVGCAQCIDACDPVMEKIGRSKGLIRYSSQQALEGETTRLIRPRVVIYSGVILLLAALFVTLLVTKSPMDVTSIRAPGKPFVITADGEVDNIMRVRIVNRTGELRTYRVEVPQPAPTRLSVGVVALEIEAGQALSEPVHLLSPPDAFRAGTLDATLRVTDDQGAVVNKRIRLLYQGPANPAASQEASAETL